MLRGQDDRPESRQVFNSPTSMVATRYRVNARATRQCTAFCMQRTAAGLHSHGVWQGYPHALRVPMSQGITPWPRHDIASPSSLLALKQTMGRHMRIHALRCQGAMHQRMKAVKALCMEQVSNHCVTVS